MKLKIHKIALCLSIFAIFSCSKREKRSTYIYNTKEYNQKVKEFNVSIDEAAEIATKFYFNKHPKSKKYDITLDIVLEDYYIFPNNPRLYNLKTGHYFLSGIWVNGKTGEIIEKKSEKYVKVVLEIPSTDLTMYSKMIENSK